MLSRFSPFRSKGVPSQDKTNDSNSSINGDDYYPTEYHSYFATDVSRDRRRSVSSPVSKILAHFTGRKSGSSRPFRWFSAFSSKQSQRASSDISDEIGIGTLVLNSYEDPEELSLREQEDYYEDTEEQFFQEHNDSYEDAEEHFLQEHEGYFVHLSVENVRKDQYPKLDLQRLVYLDYATSPLYSRFQVQQHMQILLEMEGPYTRVTSTSDNSSVHCNTYIEDTCKCLLNLFNVTQNDYTVIFTPGLASCYRLFGEMHPLRTGSFLLISPDTHQSVQYLVHASVLHGAKIEPLLISSSDLCVHTDAMRQALKMPHSTSRGQRLLIYPAQSSSTGTRHSLNWIVEAHQNGWKVLVDVANCLPMVHIDLSLYQPEFVVGSFHHILGYPSNMGFLLVRRSSHSICSQKGSARLKIANEPDNGRCVHVMTEGESLSTHIFAALAFGLQHLETIGFVAIRERVESLLAWLVKTLKSLKHRSNSKPLVQMYGSLFPKHRGSVLAFNVLDSTGDVFPAGLVQRIAERSNIFLGIISLSNPELCHILHQESDRNRVDEDSSSDQLWAVRLSLGPVSTFGDVYSLTQFLIRFGDEDYMSMEALGYVEGRLEDF